MARCGIFLVECCVVLLDHQNKKQHYSGDCGSCAADCRTSHESPRQPTASLAFAEHCSMGRKPRLTSTAYGLPLPSDQNCLDTPAEGGAAVLA